MTLGAQVFERLETPSLSVYKSQIWTGTGTGTEKDIFPGHSSVLFSAPSAECGEEYSTLSCMHVTLAMKRGWCQWLLHYCLLVER